MKRLLASITLCLATGVTAQPPPLPFYQSVAFSPDGERLAYCAVVDSWDTGYEMFVMRTDGSDVRRLGAGRYPVFSPDGKHLAFARDGDLFLSDLEGNEETTLTSGPARDSYPAFAPDGSYLVYMSSDGEDWEIYRLATDGSDRRALTDHPADDYNAAFSPDGGWLVFERHPEGEPSVLHLMRSDGSDEGSLGIEGSFPSWSPDGTRIAFAGADGIFTVHPDGTGLEKIFDGAFFATWSPDGDRLALATTEWGPDGQRVNGISLLRLDGSQRVRLLGGRSVAGLDNAPLRLESRLQIDRPE